MSNDNHKVGDIVYDKYEGLIGYISEILDHRKTFNIRVTWCCGKSCNFSDYDLSTLKKDYKILENTTKALDTKKK